MEMLHLTGLSEEVERDQRKPLGYLRSLTSEFEVLATAHSGAPGVLALTRTQLIFAWKPASFGASIKTLARNRTAIVAAQTEGGDLLVRDSGKLWRFSNVSPPERSPEIAERLVRGGAQDSVAVQGGGGPARSALSILPQKTRRLVEQALRPDESVHVVFVGAGGQAIVGADDRMLVAKSGFMAGATFGSKTLDFPYDQISGIELHVGAMTGYLQIVSPSFQANLPKSYWTNEKGHSPWQLPNCIPVNHTAATKFQGPLAVVRERIAKGYWTDGIGSSVQPTPAPDVQPSTPTVDLASQLKELAALHEAGALSDEEFAQAKQKLLG